MKKKNLKGTILKVIGIIGCVTIALCIILYIVGSNLPDAEASNEPTIGEDLIKEAPVKEVPVVEPEPVIETKDQTVEPVLEPVVEDVVAEDTKKIDKYISKKNFEKISDMYAGLNEVDKAYLVSQSEEMFKSLFADTENFDISNIINVEEQLNVFEYYNNANIHSEFLDAAYDILITSKEYIESNYGITKYNGPVNDPMSITVYISNRIGDGEGGYTDYYSGYLDYYMSYGEVIPNYDSEMVIVHSVTPLEPELNALNGVTQKGTFNTIDSRGFEYTSPLYRSYSDYEMEQYYIGIHNNMKIDFTNDAINGLGESIHYLSIGNFQKAIDNTNMVKTNYDEDVEEYEFNIGL